jgi:hypothetical protein
MCNCARLAPGASQYRLDTRRDLAQREGFDDVVVGAQFQAGDPLGLEASSGEEDHGHVADQSKFAQYVAAILGSEHDVQQDQVRFHRGGGPNGGATVGGDQDFVTLAGQERVQELGHFGVVINDQNLGQLSPSVLQPNL